MLYIAVVILALGELYLWKQLKDYNELENEFMEATIELLKRLGAEEDGDARGDN